LRQSSSRQSSSRRLASRQSSARCVEHGAARGCEEGDLAFDVEADAHAALVDRAVMASAEQHEVLQVGAAAVGPMCDVMGVGEATVAPGEPAPAIASLQSAA
jgi:hypothetical protein